MKRLAALIVFLVALLAFGSPARSDHETLRAEPALGTHISWNLESSGLLTVGYDLNHNGRPDFFTARVVRVKFISEEPIQTVARHYPNLPVFRVDYGHEGFYYIAARHPVFYAVDVNEDGRWDLVFKDVLEDGVNGNEVFYDNPSGWTGAVPIS
ncbi:MAG: hypothetical protein GWM98_13235 [Nitrospinaceae bacterium]|nr:hypothetical protein [Nitrospinaceae bacterium]NIR55254.1 hypothetical protein [Nitrospinaceae bacterium]NIS85692.1 hypothetical protein [Nitrospinaceae bacterium]NIT82543.1 hypothetical protein [Nitrospinaceae bacterium]NIU44747.1 hypothetical protein [Nitrospinaceae bacterium]